MAADSAHPGDDYYVLPLTGTIQRQSNGEAAMALKLDGWEGPFTWAEAKAHLAHHSPASLIPGLSGIDEIAAVIKAAFTAVTDWHFWASLGWIIAGAVLAVMGLRLWLGKPTIPAPAVI